MMMCGTYDLCSGPADEGGMMAGGIHIAYATIHVVYRAVVVYVSRAWTLLPAAVTLCTTAPCCCYTVHHCTVLLLDSGTTQDVLCRACGMPSG